jgi:hypothetical protein
VAKHVQLIDEFRHLRVAQGHPTRERRLSRFVGHEWGQDPAVGHRVGHQLVSQELVDPSETL